MATSYICILSRKKYFFVFHCNQCLLVYYVDVLEKWPEDRLKKKTNSSSPTPTKIACCATVLICSILITVRLLNTTMYAKETRFSREYTKNYVITTRELHIITYIVFVQYYNNNLQYNTVSYTTRSSNTIDLCAPSLYIYAR